MNARKKNKKKIIICALALVAIILVVVLIVLLVKGGKNKPVNPESEQNDVYELPDTTYTGMEVKDVVMEYLKDNNETEVTFTIKNTTDRVASQEILTAYLLNSSGDILDSIPTYIDKLDVGEEYELSVIRKGDLTSTSEISLQQNDTTNASQTQTTENTNTAEVENTNTAETENTVNQ